MKMKKMLALVLAIVMVSALAACSGNGGTGNGDQGQSTDPGQSENTSNQGEETNDFTGKTLTVGIWGGSDSELNAMEELKKGFQEKTGATLEYKVYTDLNTQIQADFIGKTAPDVFYVNAEMFPFYGELGVMEALDPAVVEADQFYDNLIAAFTNSNGELMAMPKDVSTLALYYNEDLLSEAGYTPDDIPKDLEDFKTFLPELQAKLDEIHGEGQVTAMTYNQDLARMLHLLESNGGSINDENDRATLTSEKILENLEFMVELVKGGGLKTPSDMGLGWNGEVFGTGRTVLMEEGNWVYSTLVNDFSDVNFGVKDMPVYNGEVRSINYTVGYGIYSGSSNKELAVEWLKYAAGMEGMSIWCKGAGTLPSREDVTQAINAADDPVWAVHIAQVDYSIPWQKGANLVTINSAFQNFYPSAIKGEATVLEAMEKAEKQANSEIENAQ